MVITVDPELETALRDQARRRGVAPEAIALDALRNRFLPPLQPRDEWERQLLELGRECGVSHANKQLGREALYDL